MFYVFCFLVFVCAAAAFFFYKTDIQESEVKVSEQDSFKTRVEKSLTHIEESEARIISYLMDFEKTLQNLRENVGAKFTEQDRINVALTNSQTELFRKINESEKHLDLRISKLQSVPVKPSEPVKVNIVGPITLERVTAAPVKKSLGKNFNEVKQEQTK